MYFYSLHQGLANFIGPAIKALNHLKNTGTVNLKRSNMAKNTINPIAMK